MSHAALGASWSETANGRAECIMAAGLVGGVAALAPDLDMLIRSATDPLLVLEYHRQFTHALAFAPLASLVLAAAFQRFVRTRLTFAQSYLAALLGYVGHALLDACTTYGTELFWPFSDARVAWSVIAVFDPVFSAPLVALVALATWKRRASYARLALAWAMLYMMFAVAQHARAEAAGAANAASRGHQPVRLEAIPAFSSLLLWKIVYEHDGRYYVDGVRTGFSTAVYTGESLAKLHVAAHFPWLRAGTQQAIDVERFRRVSDDLLAVDDDAANRIVDLRYSLVPNEIEGFWAVVLDPAAAPDAHVELVATRERAPEQALRLLDMLFTD